MLPYLSRITIYPVKSLDGISVPVATIADGGSLLYDRTWAMVGPDGKYVNGKRNPRVHGIRVSWKPEGGSPNKGFPVRLDIPGRSGIAIDVANEDDGVKSLLEKELSAFFESRISITADLRNGHPDDTAAWGPTIVSVATLHEVASWFPELSIEGVRRRFRANLEIDGVPAFWEDRLFGKESELVSFGIGSVAFVGVNPCARCVVPTRDPESADVLTGFQKRFMERRAATLPSWSENSRFDHYYRLSVNTRIDPAEHGKVLAPGDPVVLRNEIGE